MAHRADGLNDIFEHDITVRDNVYTTGGKIQDVPTEDKDIVNKEYVDSKFSGTGGYLTIWGAGNTLTQSILSGILYWNQVNKRLGIGTITPLANFHVVGSTRLGNQSTTFTAVSATGCVDFTGTGSGLTVTEIYGHDEGVTLTSVNVNDWDQILAFSVDGLTNGDITPDHRNNQIVINTDGLYEVGWSWAGHGTAVAHDWDFHIKKNNGATDFLNTSAHLKSPKAGNVTTVGHPPATLDLAAEDTIELWVQRTSAGNNIVLTTENCFIHIKKVGGS